MPTLPTPAELDQRTTELGELIARFGRNYPNLYHRSKEEPRDGYPSASMRDGSGGSDPETPAHGDPTGELVVAEPVKDPVRFDTAKAAEHVLVALTHMRAADGLLQRNGQPEKVRESSIINCVNCGEPALPRPRKGRCDSCRKWRDRHDGQDRPVEHKQAS